MRSTIRIAALVMAGAVLSACASGPRIYSSLKPEVTLSSYETYSYVPALGTDTVGQPTTLLTQYLRAAVDREMQARGYRYVPNGGELLVNFYVETNEKIQSRTTQSGPRVGIGLGYYAYRRGLYTSWQTYPETETSQYTEGTLNIDLADAAEHALVWEGVAIGRVTEEMRRDVRAAVDAVVPQVFNAFPGRRAAP